MNAPAQMSPTQLMDAMGKAARAARPILAQATGEVKNAALLAAARVLRQRQADILAANAEDMQHAREKGLAPAVLDRLFLDEARIEGIAGALEAIAALDDPVGTPLATWTRPNGLEISRVRVPIGVIGVIYESRPNVTVDAGALCLKAGNAVILRGGSESQASSAALHKCLCEGLRAAGLPETAVQLAPTRDRAFVGAMLTRPDLIDVVVPRGGKSLVARVQEEARVPVLAHLDGNCHVYIDKAANSDIARRVAFNAKMRRTGICGAMETLLVHEDAVDGILRPLLDDLIEAGCEIRGDARVQSLNNAVKAATAEDWDTEYLDAILAVKVVASIDDAVTHIETHGSHHTDAIISEDEGALATFLNAVDSAIVLANASTQFADGGEFGMGAEIGISTGRLHARGPVGVNELTTYKYVVRGAGQVRP